MHDAEEWDSDDGGSSDNGSPFDDPSHRAVGGKGPRDSRGEGDGKGSGGGAGGAGGAGGWPSGTDGPFIEDVD
jgi:hypothetical protein